MKPILYESTEISFENNGIGILSDAISCDVTWERNGEYEAELKYPIGGIHYESISERSIILAKPNPIWKPQPFRVYMMSKPINGVVTIKARHISYDLSGIVVDTFSAGTVGAALQMLKNKEITVSYFDYWTDKETEAIMANDKPASVRSLLGGSSGSVLDVYGGEYEFDRFMVKLWDQLGENRGVSIRYGKNLTDLKQERNCSNTYTGVYPFWMGMDGQIVRLTERIVMAEGEFDYVRIMPLDLSEEWDEAPTQEQLRARAQRYVKENDIAKPTVSLTVSFVQLEQTEEYKGKALLEQINPCDTVNVEFSKLGVSATSKCVKTIFNCLLERYESIHLGDAKNNIADTIVAQQKELAKKPGTSEVRYAVNALTAAILGASGGSVRLLDTNGDNMPDTLYIADNADPELAKKVWRFNYEGWGASSNGYNGPFTIGASLEQGLIADFITAGTLNANLIRAGVLQSKDGKSFLLDIDTGQLVLGGYPTEDEVSALVAKTANGLQVQIEDIDGDVTVLKQEIGKVSVEIGTDKGTLSTIMDDTTWRSVLIDANGEEISGLYFDFENSQFMYKGSGHYTGSLNIADKFIVDVFGNAKIYGGKYYAMDEEGNISNFTSMDKDGFTVYSAAGKPVIKIGFPTGNTSYPYIRLYSEEDNDEQSALYKKFANGFWNGNDAPADASGYFQPQEGYLGMFYDFDEGKVYVVNGKDMQNVYTGESIARFG